MADRVTDRDCVADFSSDFTSESSIGELSAQIWDSLKSKAQNAGNQVNDWVALYRESAIGMSAKSVGEFVLDGHMTTVSYVMDSNVRTEINDNVLQAVLDAGQGMVDGRDFVAGKVKDYTLDSSIGRSIGSWNVSTKELEWVKQANLFIQKGGQFVRDLI